MEETQVKIDNFFEKLHENKRMQVGFFVVCMLVLISVFLMTNHFLRITSERNISKNLEVSTDYNILFTLEKVERKDDQICFSGWMLRRDSQIDSVYVVLENTNGSDKHVAYAKINSQDDRVEYIDYNQKYKRSRFIAYVDEKDLSEDVCYEILLATYFTENDDENTEDSRKKIETNRYLYNGQMLSYNPLVFMPPAVTDVRLSNVVSEGELLAYDLDYQIWIYKYEKELFYITNPDFGSMEQAGIGIPVMLQTNHPELLPENRVQYGNDHLGFYYENSAYREDGVLPYQVIIVELPSKYPITYLSTGYYDYNADKWMKHISIPIMEFQVY